MGVKAVVGLNWGDEAKGRMVDYLAREADCVIRFQGGDNAGHTVINEYGKLVLHNFPCGISYGNVLNIISPGSVVNPESFAAEMCGLIQKGIETVNIMISDKAILILPFHLILDRLEEDRLGDRKYGSTLRGIAPAYGEKYLKKGIQAGELLYPEYLKEHLSSIIAYSNLIIQNVYKSSPISFKETYEWLMEYGERIKPFITDISPVIRKLLSENKNIILEAQLGALRDITHGIYPYTTSSSTLAGYACASVPIPPDCMKEIIGVTKAYSTCVGEGPFVTEIKGAIADEIREKAAEYGARTGRPRRIGYFDAVATRYGSMLQGAHTAVLTCLDVLSGHPELKICIEYDIDGICTTEFPLNPGQYKAYPVYETLEGWSEDISGVRDYSALPENARKYVERIEQHIGIPIKFISVGPKRKDLILR